MHDLDLLRAVFNDVLKSQELFNRAAVRIANPAARRLLCTLRERDTALLGLLLREMAGRPLAFGPGEPAQSADG